MPTQSETPTAHAGVIATDDGRRLNARIHVTRNPANNNVQFSSSHPLPTLGRVLEYLPIPARNYVERTGYEQYTVDQIQLPHITLQQWQDALIAELRERYARGPDQPEPAEFNIMDGHPNYLVSGGFIFKLDPIEQVRTNGALKALRRRITAEANKRGEIIIADASKSAAAIVAAAQKRLDDANKILADMERTKKLSPPPWAIDTPLYLNSNSNQWAVGFVLTIALTKVEFKWEVPKRDVFDRIIGSDWRYKMWKCQPTLPIKLRAWQPIANILTGEYKITAAYLDKHEHLLPHMNHTGACLAPGDAPPYIKSAADLANLARVMSRCFSVIDMYSPLVGASDWHPGLKPAFPRELWNALIHGGLQEFAADEDRILDIRAEANELWTAPAA